MAQPVQTRVPVLVQEEAEQVAVEDIVAGNEEDLGVGNNPHRRVEKKTTRRFCELDRIVR